MWKHVVGTSETCVRKPPLKLTLVADVERWLSCKGICHVILLLMNICNICFCGEMRKILGGYPLIWSNVIIFSVFSKKLIFFLSSFSYHWSLLHQPSYLLWLRAATKIFYVDVPRSNVYRIWLNYHTYPYRCTDKQFHSLQITASVHFVYFFYKSICYGYPFELHQLVSAIQMSTHNICFYKENQKKKKQQHKNIA